MMVAKEPMLDGGEVWVEEVVVAAGGVHVSACAPFLAKLLLPMKRFPLFARLRRHM